MYILYQIWLNIWIYYIIHDICTLNTLPATRTRQQKWLTASSRVRHSWHMSLHRVWYRRCARTYIHLHTSIHATLLHTQLSATPTTSPPATLNPIRSLTQLISFIWLSVWYFLSHAVSLHSTDVRFKSIYSSSCVPFRCDRKLRHSNNKSNANNCSLSPLLGALHRNRVRSSICQKSLIKKIIRKLSWLVQGKLCLLAVCRQQVVYSHIILEYSYILLS